MGGNMNTIIEVKNLTREYGTGNIQVLKGIDFCAFEEEFVAIMGRSGGGKSTLLRVLGLMDQPTEGEVFFRDENSKDLWDSQLADIRRREIGFVHQDARLLDCLTVEQNIKLPMILDKKDSKTMQESMEEQTRRFGIADLVDKYPTELSGGEKQRTALCRALINHPELILADEPTGNLDSQSGELVIQALETINRDMEKTVILVTHDPWIASYSKKAVLLKDGVILDTLLRPDGEGEEVQKAYYEMILGKLPEL